MSFMGLETPSLPVVVVENPVNLTLSGHPSGNQLQLAAGKHFQTGLHVREQIARADFKLNQGFQFVQSAVPLNRLVDILVKPEDVRFRRRDALTNGQLPQGVHDSCHIDAVGALAGTGMASYAQPNGPAFQGLIPGTHLDQADHLVGHQIHVIGKRTAAATSPAMPASADILSSQVVDDFQIARSPPVVAIANFNLPL
jgi:hypothetical protein